MKRYIYAFDSAASAHAALITLRLNGIDEQCMSLIARSDIQLEKIPEKYLDASTDFMPALGRGVAIGGITGLFAGLVAMAIPPLGIAIGGSALLAFFGGGAVLGAWSSALVGSSIPDEIRRKFEDEITAGRTLLVIDADGNNDALITTLMATGEDRHLVWQSDIDVAAAA
jgi:uncharacterized membrane protein